MSAVSCWSLLVGPLLEGSTYAEHGAVELETHALRSGAPGIHMYVHGDTVQCTLAIMELAASRFGDLDAPARVNMLVERVGSQVEVVLKDSVVSRQRLETFYGDVFPLLPQCMSHQLVLANVLWS